MLGRIAGKQKGDGTNGGCLAGRRKQKMTELKVLLPLLKWNLAYGRGFKNGRNPKDLNWLILNKPELVDKLQKSLIASVKLKHSRSISRIKSSSRHEITNPKSSLPLQ
ncbi:hypothetical protein Tco_0527577 [Tanacetum coccineum]